MVKCAALCATLATPLLSQVKQLYITALIPGITYREVNRAQKN